MHKLEDFEPQTKVVYVPSHLQKQETYTLIEQAALLSKTARSLHAPTNLEQPNYFRRILDAIDPCLEYGVTSSKTSVCVFVKFYPQLSRFGWDGTTSQGCRPEDLVIVR